MIKRNLSPLIFLATAYSVLFILSILFIVPRYLSGGLGGFFLALLTDTEPEGLRVRSFFAPLIWILIPLMSLGLCAMSWVTYGVPSRSNRPSGKLARLGGALFLVASFLPAIVVVRELLIYRVFGSAPPGLVGTLTSFVLVLRDIMNPTMLLGRGGVWVVPVVIFVETGLFFGFFLPGDSLLLTVGVLGSVGRVNLALLIPFSILGALLGDQLGYAIGRRSGEALAYRYQFVRDNLQRASEFYSRYGGKAIVLARFVPVVRTFAPIVAGAAGMSYSRFTISNFAGGTLWVLSVMLAGYFVGRLVPAVTGYLNPLILVVILTSPLVWILAWVWGRTQKGPQAAKLSP